MVNLRARCLLCVVANVHMLTNGIEIAVGIQHSSSPYSLDCRMSALQAAQLLSFLGPPVSFSLTYWCGKAHTVPVLIHNKFPVLWYHFINVNDDTVLFCCWLGYCVNGWSVIWRYIWCQRHWSRWQEIWTRFVPVVLKYALKYVSIFCSQRPLNLDSSHFAEVCLCWV